jgi:tetratricopeptide (TPR) repeat protein
MRHLAARTFRFLITAALLACAPRAFAQQDLVAEGAKALDAKQYDRAVELFEKALAADPKDINAHFDLAVTLSQMEKDDQAIPHYKAVLELNPDIYEAKINMALSLIRAKRAGESIPYLQSAVAQRPAEFDPVLQLADALVSVDRFAEAQAAYEKALTLQPDSAAAESGLGHSLARQGQFKAAETHFRKAAKMDDSYKADLLELAAMYEKANQTAEALALYREFPDDPSARIARAQAFVKEKQMDKAAAEIAPVVAAQPKDYDLRMFYARLLRDQRKFNDAAPQFLTATKLKPEALEPWNELSSILVIAEQYDQALAALDKIRAMGGENAGHLFYRAMALDHMNMPVPAMESYRKFLEMSAGQHMDQEFQARQRIKTLEIEQQKKRR